MYHGDPAHSGVSAAMPAVAGALRIVRKVKLDGQVYASPIAVNGVIVVATENDSIYGFTANGGQLWPGRGARREHRARPDRARPRTGKIEWRKSVDLPGPDPVAMQQRGALAITGGRVWASFGA
jgi:PQQ-like domain